MAGKDSLGQFEELVLTAVLTLRDGAYGVSIHAKVEQLAAPKSASLEALMLAVEAENGQ